MISIDWGPKIITIPRADLSLVQVEPETRELDLDSFRLTLKDLEDSENGIFFDQTHNHNPPVSVGGITLARVVEIINGYTITFEDGPYGVNVIGGNSNILNVVNRNSVGVNTTNSGGLVQTLPVADDVWGASPGSFAPGTFGALLQDVPQDVLSSIIDGATNLGTVLARVNAWVRGKVVLNEQDHLVYYAEDDVTEIMHNEKVGTIRYPR